MFAYLSAAFFSVLSNCVCVIFVKNGLIVLKEKQLILDVFLVNNVINVIFFTIFFYIQKVCRKNGFIKITDVFKEKKDIIQFLLFVFPVIAAVFKTYMLDFIPVTTITISSLIVPYVVWLLAVFLLKEPFRRSYITCSLFGVCGFIFVNIQKLSNGNISFGFIDFLLFYILLESIGQVVLRFYCRKRQHGMQAVFAEILIYFIYGGMFLIIRGTFSLSLFLNPYVWIISFFCFLRHVLLISGVRKASSIVALEFCAFAKPIFASIIMFVFVGEIPTVLKTLGFFIIAISIIRFHNLERKYKKVNKK